MSSNRLKFDNCSYQENLTRNNGQLSYLLDTVKFDNCSKCRIELGSVGGTAVSQIVGNLVDLENDLRGQTRINSQCTIQKYTNPCAGQAENCQPDRIYTDGTRNTATSIDTSKRHLTPCQMVRYKPVPISPPIALQGCNAITSAITSASSQPNFPRPYVNFSS